RPSDGVNLAAALAALGPVAYTAVAAPRERAASSRATTASERRLLAVVMLGPADQDGELTTGPLQRAVALAGGRLEQVADGSMVAMLEGDHQAATDQAAQAARCALALSALARHRPLAIAMGRTESGRRLPEGDVIDRAARLLTQVAERPGDL